jgi:hypothetical protein
MYTHFSTPAFLQLQEFNERDDTSPFPATGGNVFAGQHDHDLRARDYKRGERELRVTFYVLKETRRALIILVHPSPI